MKVKVLIIGAGPAGSACGIRLQQSGVECMLVDKQQFPRAKLCAGLFTHKSQICLKNLIQEDKYDTCMRASLMSKEETFSLYNGNNKLVTCKPTNPITLINRPKFDEWMVEYFISLGGRFRDGTELIDVDCDRKVAVLKDTEVEYDYLIAADGANSVVEKSVARQYPTSFKRKAKSPLCLEINVDRADLNMTGVNIFFGVVQNSYAWVFSKGQEVCIGLVKLYDTDFDANTAMRKFVSDLNIKNPQKYPLRGAMLPIGNYLKRISFRHVLFVGDAAGLVEPLTDEGIYYALQSGVYAAESIIESDIPDMIYEKKVKYLKRLIDKGGYYQNLLEKKWATRFFFKNAGKHPGFIRHFYDTQIENTCLDSFIQIILKYKLR